jgi:Tfp pilus assembly PilM family ATPase
MKLPSFLSRLGGRRRTAVTAIDVGLTSVRAVHLRRDGEALVLDGFRVTRMPEGPSDRALEAGVRAALELRLDDEPVAIAVSSPEAAIRKVELPPMTPDELYEALPWEARKQVAGLADDAILDVQVLSPGGESTPMEVVLVAFPRDQYDRAGGLFERLGAPPAFVDLRQLATLNSLSLGGPPPARPIAVLDLGSAIASFSILTGRSLFLFRDLSPRLANLNALLAGKFTLGAEALESLKVSGKLPDGKTPAPGAIRAALADLEAELAEDLRSGLLYLENRSGGSLDHVYLTGGNAIFLDRYGIAEAVSTQSGVALERYNPFQGLRLGMIDEIALKAHFSELVAAAGVAARFFGAG